MGQHGWRSPGSARFTHRTDVKAGTLLFLLDDDAELRVARGTRTGLEPVAQYTVADSATWAQPAISGHRIFVKDPQSLTLWTLEGRREP